MYYVSDQEVGGKQGREYRIKVDWFLDLSENPIDLRQLKERLGFLPHGTIRKIITARNEVARMIAERLHHRSSLLPEEIPGGDAEIIEGAKKRVWVNAYERSEAARLKCIERWGLNCHVCGVSLEDFYGSYGAGYLTAATERLRQERETLEAQNRALEVLARRKEALALRLRDFLAEAQAEQQAIESEFAAVLAGSRGSETGD